MRAVFKRELGSLFRGMTGWLIAASVLLAFAVAFWLGAKSGMEYGASVTYAMAAFAIIVPVYSAKGFASDARQGADRLLHSLPLRPAEVVFGKYAAMCAPFLGALALVCAYTPFLSAVLITPLSRAYIGLLLYALCGLALIGASLYISMLTKSALINALLSLALLAAVYFIKPIASFMLSIKLATLFTLLPIAALFALLGYRATGALPSALLCGLIAEAAALFLLSGNAPALAAFWGGVRSALGVFEPMNLYMAGMLDLGAIAYYAVFAALFLFFAAQRYSLNRLTGRRASR